MSGNQYDHVGNMASASQLNCDADGGPDLNHGAELDESPPQQLPISRLAIKAGRRIILLQIAEITWVEAEHNYVQVHLRTLSYRFRGNIGAIERRLPRRLFVRISRSAIVHLDRVMELEPTLHGAYAVTLDDGKRLVLSRRYRCRLPAFGVV